MSSTTPRIALLGTGLMGAPMARRLLAAGFPLTAWNRSRAKAEALAVHGATVAETAAEAVRGVAEAMPAGATLIDMSSIPPSTARDHAARLAARGVDYLDAPVSGGTLGAEAGTLAIMAGGEADVFERAVPVFAPMGRAVRVGPSGSGQLAKLANQAIVGITIGAVAEALLLVERGGADPAAVREAIRGGFAESRILEVHGRRMIERDFVPGGKVVTQIKDLETIVRTADEIGLDLPLSRNVLRRYIELRERQDAGDLDHAALFLQLEAANPL
jgi:2-hydroxy-3-oxopropionate reductase